MKKYKSIIYDIDGTILNTLNMNMYPLIKIIKEEKNIDVTFEEVLKFAVYPGMKTMEELEIQDKEETYKRWVKYVNEYEEGATLFEGFNEVFEKLDGQVIQAIVSSKTKAQYKIDIIEKNLDKYFETAVLADDTKLHKPNPEPLLECLKRLNIDSKDAIYIGDSFSDYLAASSCNMDFGFAKWGAVSMNGTENFTYIFEEPRDLLKLL